MKKDVLYVRIVEAQNVDDMITPRSIFTVTVPEWTNKVKTGNVVATYYGKGTKLPAKHKGAKLKKFGKKHYYVNSKNKKIVRNPDKVGNPIYWNLNGQQFYTTNIHWALRSNIVNFYHRYFKVFIKNTFKTSLPVFESYKINMEIIIYDIYSKHTPDITNMWILAKLFEDAMVKEGVLRDDSPEFRGKTSYEYRFIRKKENRKLVIKFKYKKNE